MNKIVLTADLHLQMWNDTYVDDNGIPLRLAEIVNSVKEICNYAKSNNINKVGILGDINDLKDIAHTRAFVYFIKNVIEVYTDIHFYILHGNHDSSSFISRESSIDLFSGTNVTIISSPQVINNIAWVPHSKSILDDINSLIKDSKDIKILFSHFGLNEGTLSSGISIKTNISAKHLKNFKVVVLGHYHKPQSINNVHYVGSPIQLRKDEAGEEKRFLVLDLDTYELESKPLNNFRKYKQIAIKSKDELDDKIEEALKLKENRDYVSLSIEYKAESTEINNIRESAENIVVNFDTSPETKMLDIKSSMTMKEQMIKYMEMKQINEKDKDKFLATGLEIISNQNSLGD